MDGTGGVGTGALARPAARNHRAAVVPEVNSTRSNGTIRPPDRPDFRFHDHRERVAEIGEHFWVSPPALIFLINLRKILIA